MEAHATTGSGATQAKACTEVTGRIHAEACSHRTSQVTRERGSYPALILPDGGSPPRCSNHAGYKKLIEMFHPFESNGASQPDRKGGHQCALRPHSQDRRHAPVSEAETVRGMVSERSPKREPNCLTYGE